ncbi:MAG: hypothetical protein AAFY41_07775 [Bacteroidota bacterium]
MKFEMLILLVSLVVFSVDAHKKKKSDDDQPKSAFEELSSESR